MKSTDESLLKEVEEDIDYIIDAYYSDCVEGILEKIKTHLLEIRKEINNG